MKRKIILVFLGILIVMLGVLRISYAFIKDKVSESAISNVEINTCAKLQLIENGNSINLENTYPMEEDKALENEGYEFSVTSACEGYVGFNLYLTSLDTNEIVDNKIRYAITDIEKNILTTGVLEKEVNKELSSEEIKEIEVGIKGKVKKIYKIYSNDIPKKEESRYRLYLWVDEEASNEVMGKSIKVGLSIKGYDREERLAEYLIKNKDDTLIYHDGKADYEKMENFELEAEDYSYRYAGANPNNYICFGGECSSDSTNANYANLYRIIGLFKNSLNLYETKLIKADYATSEQLVLKSI